MPLTTKVSELASQCVRCGLCLPKCPTYQLEPCEAESPRGRIAMLAALAKGQLTADVPLKQHIDQCLSCRSCEAVCPTHVPYEELLIHGRALIQQQHKTALPLLLRWMTVSSTRRALFLLYRSLEKCGLIWLGKHLGLTRYLPQLPSPLPAAFKSAGSYPATQPKRGQIALLLGCSSDVLEPQTIIDAITLLTRIGYDVIIPKHQACCGALHRHAGQLTEAAVLLGKTQQALQEHRQKSGQNTSFDALIHLNSGCHSTWQQSTALPAKVWEIQEFLLAHWPKTLTLSPLTVKVALHDPCSQRNGIGKIDLSLQLLAKIPGMDLQRFGQTTCCGAAGAYFLQQPVKSKQLGHFLCESFTSASDINTVVSANIGCRLQLSRHWPSQNTVQFYHPISLLALAAM